MKIQKKSTKLINFFLIFTVFLLISASFLKLGVAEDEEDEEDEEDDDDDKAEDLGVAAFGLFAISLIYPFFFQIMRVTLKLNKEKERNTKFKKGYLKFFNVVRKPLQWSHYLAGMVGIVLLSIHGIGLLSEDDGQAVLGIITGVLLAFYVLSGIIIKVVLVKVRRARKLKKILFYIHRSAILILIVLGIHIAHVAG